MYKVSLLKTRTVLMSLLTEMFENIKGVPKTIITSNLSGAEMKKIFDASLVSRVAKGSKDLSFKYPQDSEDRRTLPF